MYYRYLTHSVVFDQYLVNCDWGDYGAWSACTKTCGSGKQYRSRVIETHESNGGTSCDADHHIQEQNCNNDSCPTPGIYFVFFEQLFKY